MHPRHHCKPRQHRATARRGAARPRVRSPPSARSTVTAHGVSGIGRTRLSALWARRTAARPRGAGDDDELE